MNSGVGRARIGQWYTRLDKGETFQVIGFDESSRTIEIQAFDGDLDEIDLDAWYTLPLALGEPPEDWTGPVDDIETDDLGYSETEMSEADWAEPLQPLRSDQPKEAWQDTTAEDERDAEGEGVSLEPLALDDPMAAFRLS